MLRRFVSPVLLCALSAPFLTGCSSSFSTTPLKTDTTLSISGRAMGGDQVLTGSKIYMYAAGTGGYGTASRSMLGGPGYVTEDANGHFNITSDYTCQPGDLVYIVAQGGNPGLTAGTNNAYITLIDALGACSNLSSGTFIVINEATTIAAAYGLAGFMTSPTALSSSGTPAALTAMANAFNSTGNLSDFTHGNIYATTPVGNGTVPQAELDTLADILAYCVNTDGVSTTRCSDLMTATTPAGGSTPANVAQAALNIAHNPGLNVSTLFGYAATYSPFQPTLSAAPNDWTVAIAYTGGGILGPNLIAIDGPGNVWIGDRDGLSSLTNNGTPQSSTGYKTGVLTGLENQGLAIDTSNNAWATSYDPTGSKTSTVNEVMSNGFITSKAFTAAGFYGVGLAFDPSSNLWTTELNVVYSGGAYNFVGSLNELTTAGVFKSPAAGYSGSGLGFLAGLASDTSGDMWATSQYSSGSTASPTGAITETNQAGTVTSPTNGYQVGGLGAHAEPGDIAIDHSGNVWSAGLNTAGNSAFFKLSSAGAGLSPSSTGFDTHITDNFIGELAIDGDGRVWGMGSPSSGTTPARIVAVNNSGVLLSPASGYLSSTLLNPSSMRIDNAGNVWITNNGNQVDDGTGTGGTYGDGTTVTEFVGLASPVVTPFAYAAATNQLGARP